MGSKQALIVDFAARHGVELRRFLRSRVGNCDDIPDLVQEVFLRLLRVPNHETIRTPEAYIFTIARHVAVQHQLKAVPHVTLLEVGKITELPIKSASDPVLEVSAQQCLEELEEALRELPTKVRATFLLHRIEGLTVDQVSERLGITRPMVKKYIVKALVHFRKRLKESE